MWKEVRLSIMWFETNFTLKQLRIGRVHSKKFDLFGVTSHLSAAAKK